MLNHVLLVAAITKPPAYVESASLLKLTIGGNEDVITPSGIKSLPFYHEVKMFGQAAKMHAEKLQVGTAVLIEGSLKYETWTTGNTTMREVTIHAHRMEPLTRPADHFTQDRQGGYRLIHKAMNEVKLIGHAGRDAETFPLGNNRSGVRFSLANKESIRSQENTSDTTHWIELVAFDSTTTLAAQVRKGNLIFVRGRVVNETWTDPQNQKRHATRTHIHHLEMLLNRKPTPLKVSKSTHPSLESVLEQDSKD